jgi:penicillin-binding protein 2
MAYKIKNPFEIYSSLNNDQKKKPLDWDESAQDILSDVEELHDDQHKAPSLIWLNLFLVLAFLFLSSRVFYLQIINGTNFRALSDNNRIRSQTILAPRGLIQDRNGQIIAQNTGSFNLVAVPFDLPKDNQMLEQEIQKAAQVFAFDKDAVLKAVKAAGKNSLRPIIALQNLNPDTSILFQTKASEFLGFSLEQIPIRQYPNPKVFSHLLGYTGLVSQDDLKFLVKENYDSVDFAGKSGIEQQYENFLHGTNGQNLVEVDATGKLLNVLGRNEPDPGKTLVLNIDKELQEEIYNQLSAGKNPRAAAVALNPKTGEVLALVSLPGFDNNLFSAGISNKDYQALLSDKNLPLFNRAITGTYPPGSTVKPMVGLAGLEEGIMTPETIVIDRGSLVIANQYNPLIKYNFWGWNHSGLGEVNIYRAIAESDDIYFYQVAGGYPNTAISKGLGAEKLAEYYKKFNLGALTNIDLPGEKPGIVPTPEWKEAYFKNDPILSKWYLGDTYHVGIGQGDLLVTPLQVTFWTAAIANNGVGMTPQLLKKVTGKNNSLIFENSPKVLFERFVSEENLKVVQQAMRQTVTNGSGRQLNNLPIQAAGKTGTSQFDGSDPSRTHAWFTAYAPFNDPQIVITVLVEAGGEGNAIAVPVVKDALKWWAEHRYVK